jgi:hypothetical protein
MLPMGVGVAVAAVGGDEHRVADPDAEAVDASGDGPVVDDRVRR